MQSFTTFKITIINYKRKILLKNNTQIFSAKNKQCYYVYNEDYK